MLNKISNIQFSPNIEIKPYKKITQKVRDYKLITGFAL